MNATIHPLSESCCKSELQLFDLPLTQTSLEESHYVQITPVNSINAFEGPIEYIITSSGDLFLDPSDIFLYCKVKLVNADDSPLPVNYPAYPEKYFSSTFISQADLYLNEKCVSSSSSKYPYRSFLEVETNYSKDAKQTHLEASLYYTNDKTNQIKEKFAKSKNKEFDFIGKLHLDLCNQERLLLNGVDVKIRLLRSPNAFCLNIDSKAAENIKVKVKLLDTYLYVRRVKLAANKQIEIEKRLLQNTAKYPIRRVETKTFTLPPGIAAKNLSNIVIGNLPHRLIVGLLDHKAVQGDYKKSCFEFKNFNLRKIALYNNGISIGRPFYPTYPSDENEFDLNARSFLNFFTALGNYSELGNGVSKELFGKNTNLYPFDLTPDLSSNSCSHVNPVKQGQLSLQLEFKDNIPEALVVLLYCEYYSVLEINNLRQIITDF